MLPKLKHGQKVFIEITNKTHGGKGWDFGTCLWSPVYNRAGIKSWKIMEEVNKGDIILHLLENNGGHHWAGVSIADSNLYQTDRGPPIPDRWDSGPYQRVEVSQFTPIIPSVPINTFFNEYEEELNAIYDKSPRWSFFNKYRGAEFRINQKYLAYVESDLYELFNDYANVLSFDYYVYEDNIQLPTDNEPSYPDHSPPGRVRTIIYRTIRDTDIVRRLKRQHDWKCQICGKRISLSNGNYYAEGHHLKPLGGQNQGPDVPENIIILCPYHHAEFDYGSISIDPNTLLVHHIDPNNEFADSELYYCRSDLSTDFLKYHYDNIYSEK